MSQAGKLFDGTILPDIETLTGNSGGAVGPTGGNINVVGDGTTIDITGNPGTSTLTASFIGTTDITITGDTGGAQTGNAFTFNGGTTGLSFGGAADVFTTTFAGITANGGTVSLATDATNSTINVGTGAGIKQTTIGSINATSTTTIQSGTGALNVSSTNGALTVNSGTGALGISTDASATVVNIASGGAAKTVQLGSTTSTSSLALRYGTSDFTLASATGTVMSALDTGEIRYALQPAFLAVTSTTAQTNVTGAGATYTVLFASEIYDQNGDYNAATSVFTAPITGRYHFCGIVNIADLTAAMTLGYMALTTSNRFYQLWGSGNITAIRELSFNSAGITGSTYADMDAADTAFIRINVTNGAGNTADISTGDNVNGTSAFSGMLAC